MPSTFDAQAAFEQVTQRLDAMQASQTQTQQILLQTVEIQTGMLDSLRQLQVTQAQMLLDVRELKGDVHELKGDVRELKGDARELKGDVRELKGDVRELKGDVRELKEDVRQLRDSHLTLLRVQNNMLDYMKFTFDQQAKWNERQDQFNIIFLDELRDLKREIRQRDVEAQSTSDKMYKEIKERIVRLEDFMNDQLRKAG